MMKLNVMLDDGAFMPTRAHEWDGGLDLYSREDKVIFPQQSYHFDTGVHMDIKRGYAGILISKSGLNKDYNVQSEGLIDAGYTGSIGVTLCNHGNSMVHIKKGQKISQIVILRVARPKPRLVEWFKKTDRGDKGFGSSGKF